MVVKEEHRIDPPEETLDALVQGCNTVDLRMSVSFLSYKIYLQF